MVLIQPRIQAHYYYHIYLSCEDGTEQFKLYFILI